jgi:hypothetical protein
MHFVRQALKRMQGCFKREFVRENNINLQTSCKLAKLILINIIQAI